MVSATQPRYSRPLIVVPMAGVPLQVATGAEEVEVEAGWVLELVDEVPRP